MDNPQLDEFIAEMLAKFIKDYFNGGFFRNAVNDGLMVMGLDFYDRDDGQTECKFYVYDADDLSEKHDLVIEFDERLAAMSPIKAGVLTAAQVAIRVDRFLQHRKAIKARSQLARSASAKKAAAARWKNHKKSDNSQK